MSKWIAETIGLESKLQLKAHRDHKLNALMRDFFLSPWCDADKIIQATLFVTADTQYETNKANLKAQLLAISSTELTAYFNEIGVQEVSLDKYLPRSPV